MQITLPILHDGQRAIYANRGRFNRIRCGRRFGKTTLLQTIALNSSAAGQLNGWFTPQFKTLAEAFYEITTCLEPIIDTASKMEGVVRLINGGRIDFWSLENDQAGRSRKYHNVFIDEAAFTRPAMLDMWQRAIEPTLLDYVGKAWVASTPNGMADDNFFYRLCAEGSQYGFIDHHAPTSANPMMSLEELERIKARIHPLVWRQEFEAEFVDWSGSAFFDLDKMLVDNGPVPYPTKCDTVFAVIDTAIKGGKEHDGTAVVYCSFSQYHGHKLVILDWDVVQIDGALLENWMPKVFVRCEELARTTGARHGCSGVWIEDANSGTILLQQGRSRGWLTHKIDSKLTMAGKDERAISVSGYVYQGLIKLSDYAYNKTVVFKEISKNHLVGQLADFRIGDKNAYRRSDDLLDCAVYCFALALGDKFGY